MAARELFGGDYGDLCFAFTAQPVADFVREHVAAAGVEADVVQMLALTRALGVQARIASIDATTKGGAVVNAVPDDGAPAGLAVDLLYRPGHYDMLVAKGRE